MCWGIIFDKSGLGSFWDFRDRDMLALDMRRCPILDPAIITTVAVSTDAAYFSWVPPIFSVYIVWLFCNLSLIFIKLLLPMSPGSYYLARGLAKYVNWKFLFSKHTHASYKMYQQSSYRKSNDIKPSPTVICKGITFNISGLRTIWNNLAHHLAHNLMLNPQK